MMIDQEKQDAFWVCKTAYPVSGCACAVSGRWRDSCRTAYRATRSDVASAPDSVSHPPHYTQHPSGVECIQITEHMGFCLGNAVKYIWRADLKHDAIEDLRKARWYLDREIARRTSGGDDAQGR